MQNLIEVKSFNVAGVKFRPADVIAPLTNDEELRLEAEPTNAYDPFAIKVLCLFKYDVVSEADPEVTSVEEKWEFIGYVPKKDTWIFHLLRKLSIKLSLKMLVNHDARDEDKLLVRAFAIGDENASFI